ncbi:MULTISPECIES: SMI1/KNR4 family protein [Stenotrophomonas]|uniref:SMI1/KNR4 family protein n=1 Tax=Stenotrophomonas TaxID=40323 RepID=UPI00131EE837|nr:MULTISPECIES: SMI1/KNR4 family protein [Stenotrophomonas]
MAQPPVFARNNVAFNDSAPSVPIDLVAAMVPGSFPGRDGFIAFYAAHNGGYFDGGAVFYRNAFYEAASDEFNRLELEAFHYIEAPHMPANPRLVSMGEVMKWRRDHHPEARAFLEFHIPFAGDCGDNDYWIDLRTGAVKFTVSWDGIRANEAIPVAPDFLAFCANIQRRSL